MKEVNQNEKDLDISEEKSIKTTKVYLRNVEINQESYETKILSEENIDNVIKLQVSYDGENRVLVYDVGNSVSLEEYIKGKHLRKQDICDIVTSVDDILLSIENYLISENSISLDPRLIRVVSISNRMKLKFIVIPNYTGDFSFELSKLLIRVLRFIDVEDKEALNLAYGLFVKSSKENYLIGDLMELIDRAQMKVEKETSIAEYDDFKMYDEMAKDYENGLSQYDEEARYLSEEDLIDNSIINDKNAPKDYIYNDIVIDNRVHGKNISGLIMDDDTKEFLEDEIYEDFDKEDKKIIRFNKDSKKSRKKRKLNAHINMGYVWSFFAPIMLIVVPVVYFIMNGREQFTKNIAFIIVYELLVIILLVVNKIKNYRTKIV